MEDFRMSDNKFFKCYYEILQNDELKESEKRLLITLLGIRDTKEQQLSKESINTFDDLNPLDALEEDPREDPNVVTVTLDYLVLTSYLNRSTVFKALESLRTKGLIKIKKRNSRYIIKINYDIKNNLWLKINNNLMEDLDYTWGEKLVYSYYISLSQLQSFRNGCKITLKAMAETLGISNNTVKNAKLSLISKKILRENKNGILLTKKANEQNREII